MGCYQFTGSLSAVCWCAYMMDRLLGFSCDAGGRLTDLKEKAAAGREGETAATRFLKMFELFRIAGVFLVMCYLGLTGCEQLEYL